MVAPNDLTWQQLQAGLAELGYVSTLAGKTVDGIYRISFDTSEITNANTITDPGVLKFISKLLDACKVAQDRLNLDSEGKLKPAGERLDAFPPATTGVIANGQVPTIRTVRTRSDLSSVTKITGATA